jgi:hemerythrin superfamily protein
MNAICVAVATGIVLLTSAVPASAAPPFSSFDTIPAALKPLGLEHKDLRANFNLALNRAVAPAATRADRDGLINFLRSRLIPHAQVEERVVYPALETVLETRGFATTALVLDHRAIAQLTLELATLSSTDSAAFQRKALAISGVVERHFDTEEDFVFPNLARRMDAGSLRALLAQLETERIVPWSPQ